MSKEVNLEQLKKDLKTQIDTMKNNLIASQNAENKANTKIQKKFTEHIEDLTNHLKSEEKAT